MRGTDDGVGVVLNVMETGRIALRIMKIIALSVFSFIALYFIAVLIGGIIPAAGTAVPGPAGPPGGKIILDNNGRHIDVWLPSGYCGFMDKGNSPDDRILTGGDSGWYGFGWGDRDFFLNTPRAGDVKAGLLLKALFLPSRSVLAVQYSPYPPSGREIPVSEENLFAAAEYIKGWFISADGSFISIPSEEVDDSYHGYRFFESGGSYSLFFTSNNWINRLLKFSGLSARLWTPLTFGID